MTDLPFQARVAINITGEAPDEFGFALRAAFDLIRIGQNSGEGQTVNGTRYSYTYSSNQPRQPITMEYLAAVLQEHASANMDMVEHHTRTGGEPFVADVTVDIVGRTQDDLDQVLGNAFEVITFGGAGGEGFTALGTRYTCKLETNLPSTPATLPNIARMLMDNIDPDDTESREILEAYMGIGDTPATKH